MIDEEGLNIIHQIVRIAHSLPTSSASKSVVALMMLHQELKMKRSINITDEMLLKFQEVRDKLNKRKSSKKQNEKSDPMQVELNVVSDARNLNFYGHIVQKEAKSGLHANMEQNKSNILKFQPLMINRMIE